ncbi:hypothetical protein V5O48_006965 [Marasmius crinis-equi]|uniref:MYND-type domain-containing protein n=1 Tax=Marasmius crinis-equi TaxID=585013 RepID=A0ABR3FI70_9AGAR
MTFNSRSCHGSRRLLAEVVKEYPSSIIAIEHLRRTRIPNTGFFDLSYPGADVNSVIAAMMALCEHLDGPRPSVAVGNIEKYWVSVLRPWVVFLLHQICRGEPSTPEGVDIFENLLAVIPPILAIGLGYIRPASTNTPDSAISPLIFHIWLRAVERHHISWGPWSALMTYMTESWPEIATSLGYTDDSNMQSIFLHHLDYLTQVITTLPASFVSNIANFLCVIYLGGSAQESLLGSHSFRKATIPALVRIISGLVRKRKTLRHASGGSYEREAARRVVSLATRLLTLVVVDPSSVAAALDAGILKVIIKAHRCLFVRSHHDGLTASCVTLFCCVLDNISIFLIWPSVLRRFLKSGKTTPTLEMELKTKNGLVWEAWERTFAKANELGDFWKDLKKQISPLCNYDQCPGVRAVQTKPDYFHCTGCFRAIYCSAGCRKSDWRGGHREFCIRLSLKPNEDPESQDSGTSLTGREFQFFQACQRKYACLAFLELFKHAGTTENLVFLFTFDSPKLPTSEDFVILSRDKLYTLATDDRWNGSLGVIKERCRSAGNETLVVTSFPKSYQDVWVVTSGVQFGASMLEGLENLDFFGGE